MKIQGVFQAATPYFLFCIKCICDEKTAVSERAESFPVFLSEMTEIMLKIISGHPFFACKKSDSGVYYITLLCKIYSSMMK